MYDAKKTTYSSKTDMTFAMMSSRYAGAPGVTLMTPIYLHRQYSKWEMNRFIVISICVIIRSRFNLLNSPFSRYYCHMLHQVLLVVPILLGLSKLLCQSRRLLPSILSALISHLEGLCWENSKSAPVPMTFKLEELISIGLISSTTVSEWQWHWGEENWL